MNTNDDGISLDPPRPEAPRLSGPPLLQAPPSFAQPPFQPQAFTPSDDAPTAAVVPTGTAGKRSKGKVVGGLIAVVALVGAGGFAVSKIATGDDGGAANPTEVGTRLMDALAAEDALGVVDLLLPGEREVFRQPLIDLVDNLKRLGIADDTASLTKVAWLDLTFDDVQVEQTETNVDDITDIRVTATSLATLNGEAVPIGDLLIDEAFGGDRPDLGTDSEESDVDWKLATVKHDGRWYLSAFYSIAETARVEGGGQDIPDRPIVARGADTPDGAVQAIFDAVDDLDLEALIAALNPNEAEALQRYAPLFIDDAQASLDELDADVGFSNTEFTVIGDGDRRTVTVDGFDMTATFDGEEVSVSTKDGCTVVTSGDDTTNSCEIGGTIDDALGVLGLEDNEDLKSLVTTVQDAFADMKPLGITVQQVNGKWFVSPIGTYADTLLTVMGALDKNELTAIIDGVRKVSESLSTGEIFDIGGDTDIGADEDTSEDGDLDTSGFEACFDEMDYEGYSACLQAGIDEGTIDPTFVAAFYRFEECGVGERYWSGEVYNMGDEEFTAFATAAAPCFQQYVADGTISEFELPYELSHPECLEGRNWYNVIDDDDYGTRVFECAT